MQKIESGGDSRGPQLPYFPGSSKISIEIAVLTITLTLNSVFDIRSNKSERAFHKIQRNLISVQVGFGAECHFLLVVDRPC